MRKLMMEARLMTERRSIGVILSEDIASYLNYVMKERYFILLGK